MPEDGKTWFGRQTAGQSRALIADGMAVTLLVGGDAGVSGDAAMGSGKTTSRAREVEAGRMNALEARRGQGGPASR